MKLFAVLFSGFILCLSVLPCTDNQDCHHESEVQTSLFTDHSDHNQDEESCPPFCICACCGQICASENPAINVGIILSTAFQIKPIYSQGFADEIYFNIWQPPKIS